MAFKGYFSVLLRSHLFCLLEQKIISGLVLNSLQEVAIGGLYDRTLQF